jgi:hypothetical protein
VCALLGFDPQSIRKRLRAWEREAASGSLVNIE